jgi:N-acetylmuramoyl-L-alanine amidase
MNSHSDIKQAVLRGVYEDNTGTPRSSHGRGRSSAVSGAARSRPRPVYQRRTIALVLLGIAALLGINFRLVMIDGDGPAAMQVSDIQLKKLPGDPASLLSGSPNDLRLDADRPDSLAQAGDPEDTPLTTGQYDAMLARLAIPMADLFNLEVHTIVIDPGHGGIDPGATGRQGLKEKDVALDIARRLSEKLNTSGVYRILLTREDDRKVFLKERVEFANENRADLFISIHINSLPAGAESLNYVETYYFGPHTDQRTLELAEKENRGSDYVMGDFRQVIARIGDTMKSEESRMLANSIHERLYNSLWRRNPELVDAGSKTGPFVVLLGVNVPSVLVEVSCISNKAEETRLSRPAYRDDIADFLKAGIEEYLEQRADRNNREGGKSRHVAKQEGQHAVHWY